MTNTQSIKQKKKHKNKEKALRACGGQSAGNFHDGFAGSLPAYSLVSEAVASFKAIFSLFFL
jgi:hypothetical protein